MNIEASTTSYKRIHENIVTYDRQRNTRVKDLLKKVCDSVLREGNASTARTSQESPRKSPGVIRRNSVVSDNASESPQVKRKGVGPFLRNKATDVKSTGRKTKDFMTNLFSRSSKNRGDEASAPRPKDAGRNSFPELIWSISKINEAKARIKDLFDVLAIAITKNTLSLSDKKQRIYTYIGALRVILEANVCHGDLKPENILWDEILFVISDFNGAIALDDVCAAMHKEFIFKSEEQKNAVRKVVHFLTEPNPKPLMGNNHDAILQLIDWGILNTNSLENCSKETVYDFEKLQELKDYLATKFLPDSTKGYASEQYIRAMCNYFWQGAQQNFRLACQAFDIRAAALTIYAILTGTCPPKNDDDISYYNRLEQSLKDIGVSPLASLVIRRMAEPKVPTLDEPFVLPITFEELAALQEEFNQKKQKPRQLSTDNEDLKLLELIQASISHLSLLSKDEEDQIEQITQDFKAEQESMDGHELPLKCRLTLIERAFKGYPDACEVTSTIDEKEYTTVLLLDPDNLRCADIVVKQESIGVGGSAIAYKALSLRSLKPIVIKYFQELADPNEANNANVRLAQIGGHEGIQSQSQLFKLQRKEGYKQVAVEPYYKNCDFASCIFGDLFCSKWGIPKEPIAVRKKLEEIDAELQEDFGSGSKDVIEKLARLDAFIGEYGKTFTGIFGEEKAIRLFEDYRILIYSTPKMGTTGLRSPLLKRNGDEVAELLESCTKQCNDFLVIDKDLLQQIINSHSSLEDALKAKAREFMVTSIRTCQAAVLKEYLQHTSASDNPHTVSKEWVKGATLKAFGDKNLDLKGINRISARLGIDAVVEVDPSSRFQNDLGQLTTILSEAIFQ